MKLGELSKEPLWKTVHIYQFGHLIATHEIDGNRSLVLITRDQNPYRIRQIEVTNPGSDYPIRYEGEGLLIVTE